MEAAFNEWDFQPISLTPDQIIEPLSVIDGFFETDSLDGHLKTLVKWREYVLKDDYFKDDRNSPHGVYSQYKQTLNLIDAAYIILKNWPTDNKVDTQISDTINLFSESEKHEVYSTLSSFFATYSLPHYRYQIEEWLGHALSKTSADGFIETTDLIAVYENLQRLYSAAWMLHFYNRDNVETGEENNKAIIKPIVKDANLYQLNPDPSALNDIAGRIIDRITAKLTTVQAIIYLGVPPVTDGKLYFLVLTSNAEQRLAQSLASMIEESCRDIAAIVALVHYTPVLYNGIEKHNPFFLKALNGTVIYLSGGLLLPKANTLNLPLVNEDTAFKWLRWYSQGKDFLAGAAYYLQGKRYGAALFSLHQCAECVLTAVIRGVTGYAINNHNLSRQLVISQMFTNDFVAVFDLDNEETAARFEILKHGYIEVSYKDTFEPDISAIETLYQDVNELCIRVENSYQKHLLLNHL